MDGVLIQPDTHHSAIGKNLCINYKINSIHDATKTLASILVFLTNPADWKPGKILHQLEKPRIVAFLEQVICKLASTAGCDWQYKFKAQTHIGLTLLIKVQRILLKLSLVAGDQDVGEWNFDEGPIGHKEKSDLQLAFHLMVFFLEDLNQAIVQEELVSFLEVPQLYTALFPPTATSSRGSDRTRTNNTSTINQSGRSGGGPAEFNKRGDDN
mmetsp:Transcript_51268/g.55496  ORF Transcript_51268/g.55496 Transcript_51268/m.55496 type:complete len:212 (+) Transcript_51268:252-887(+)